MEGEDEMFFIVIYFFFFFMSRDSARLVIKSSASHEQETRCRRIHEAFLKTYCSQFNSTR